MLLRSLLLSILSTIEWSSYFVFIVYQFIRDWRGREALSNNHFVYAVVQRRDLTICRTCCVKNTRIVEGGRSWMKSEIVLFASILRNRLQTEISISFTIILWWKKVGMTYSFFNAGRFQLVSMDVFVADYHRKKSKFLVTFEHYSDFVEVDHLTSGMPVSKSTITTTVCKKNLLEGTAGNHQWH